MKLLVKNAKQVVCVCSTQDEMYKAGPNQNEVHMIENASVVVNSQGRIEAVGPVSEIERDFKEVKFEKVIDATGKCILPGFCDAHTHAVWSGDRVHEFKMKLAGATYMDIHKAGGGIGFTVGKVRESPMAELEELLKQRLDRVLRYGTTLLEVKSGYGLDCETEMKMLKVIHNVNKTHPVDLVANFCGAHSVPKQEKTADEYTKEVIEVQIPKLVELREKGEVSPIMIDVFFEEGVFDVNQTRSILLAGKNVGLEMNFHGDELHFVGAGELAGELGALAVSHCEHVSEQGISDMSKRPTQAVLLPNTAHVLRINPPPARKIIEGNVPVSLGSDLNPNAHCTSMPHIMNMACLNMYMTMNESLIAATINSAASMAMAKDHGSIVVGKLANMVVLDAPSWEHVIYQMADPPISMVIIRGNVHKNAC